jgi:peroxiredoxin/mono/diheme cytochrome c family protein
MRSPLVLLLPLLLLAILMLPAPSAEGPTKPIANFSLNDLMGKEWSLEDHKDKKAIAVVFLGTESPLNNAYCPRLAELYKEYGSRGVAFIAINANAHDTPVNIAAHAREYAIPFPVLKDPTGGVADAFGARRTPEAFLLDGDRRIAYQGRIDDQFGVGFKRTQPAHRDLAQAIDEVLAGKPVSVAKTAAPGCLIDRAAKPSAEGAVTYTKDVSRILQKNCETCHRPGQVGPMSLQNYDEVLAWSDTIREVVSEHRMPPWHADPKFGEFANDRSLSSADLATLVAWVNGGCPKGEDKDLPPEKTYPEGWSIGTPDVVYEMQKSFKIPAKAGERGIEYQHFVVPTNFAKDMWIQAAEAKPGNRSVVHHIIVFVRSPGEKMGSDPDDRIGSGFLVGYAPGDMPAVFAPGTAKRIPRGAELVFQMHYTPNGVEAEDRSSVGLIFTKTPTRHEVKTRGIDEPKLSIPKGAKDHEVTSSSVFRREADLIGFMPHMHLRGKDFEYRVVYPNGKSDVVLRVPHYDFSWQSSYRLKKPLRVPAGTRVECTAHFDNSADNPNNPDPTKPVYWGDQTWEEMMIGFVDYSYTGSRSLR